MSSVNLYDVLNISQDCTTQEIKNAYRNLAKEFHPDRPNGDAEMFELITHAYNILVNTNSRKEYDEIYALSKQVDTTHFDMKSKAKDYFNAMDTDVTKKKKSKEDFENDFKKNMEDMDRINNYKRATDEEFALSDKKTSKRLRDLELARQQDDIENMHDEIFEGGTFILDKFNAAFDAMYKDHTELIPHVGNPLAYNTNDAFADNFISVDKYDKLYDDENILGNSYYGSAKLDSGRKTKITKEQVRNMQGAEYTKGYNNKDANYSKYLDDRLKNYESDTIKYGDRTMNEFDVSDDCGGYGIFSQIGIKDPSALTWDDGEDIKKKYNKMLEMRKIEL